MDTERKRPASVLDAERETKRPLTASNGPVTEEDIEEFQKEAVYRRMASYKRETEALQTKLDALTAPDATDVLSAELDRVTKQLLETQAQLDRLKSPSVARCLDDRSTVKKSEEQTKSSEKEADSQVNQQALNALNEELAGLKGENEQQTKQISELLSKLHDVENSKRESQFQPELISETDLKQHEHVKNLEAQIESLGSENDKQSAIITQLQRTIGDLKTQQSDYELNIREQSRAQKTELERALDVALSDVARIRQGRDEVLSQIAILKAGDDEKAKRIKELDDLLKIAEESRKVETNGTVNENGASPQVDITELQRRNQVLSAEVVSLETAFAKAHAKAVAKVRDTAIVDARLAEARVGKARADEKYFEAMRSKDALAMEIARLKSALTKSGESISAIKESERKLTATIARLQKQINDLELNVQSVMRAQSLAERQRDEVKAKRNEVITRYNALEEQLRHRDMDVKNEQISVRSLEASVAKLTKQLEIKRSTSGDGGNAVVQEQLESLRSIALCSLCQKNWKDTAITLCGHVFCAECVQKRLDNRMRKCPMCTKSFGHGDVLTVRL